MHLIIVESPTKARTISKFLGNDYSVEATLGHVMDLPKSELGIDIQNNFKPKYLPVAKAQASVERIKKLAQKADKIYLATDPDREGEAIASHVAEILSETKEPRRQETKENLLDSSVPRFLTLQRIVFHEITKDSVEEAITKPRNLDKNLIEAQMARRVLDRLVGYKLSPLLWRKIRRGLSAGRVQSVAVRLIVEKEREIEKFKPEEFWEITCEVKPKNRKDKNFIVRFIGTKTKKIEVRNSEEAKKITEQLKKAEYSILDISQKEIRKNPYPPFTTSTMTQAAARIFGWSAKKTMAIAQRLYEKGLITYHRTDSMAISKTALIKARKLIKDLYGQDYLSQRPRLYKATSKVAQEAHEAIRPTKLSLMSDKIKSKKYGRDAQVLYGLIWRRLVASQMVSSLYDETVINVLAKSSQEYLLKAKGQVIKFDGWRKVIPHKKNEEKANHLPQVSVGEALKLVKIDSSQKFTEFPPRYNEASLIKTLEKLGIGRPSTYAPIISTIQVRNYVEKEDGKFVPTPVGVAVNDFLVENFPDIFDYRFTAEMEDDLDKIANGQIRWVVTIKKFWHPFSKKLEMVGKHSERIKIEVEKLGQKCPKCRKGELVVRIGKFGKFVSCSLFPKCDYSEKFLEKIGLKCPNCNKGEVIVKKTLKGKKFFGCSRFPACKWASWKNPKRGETENNIRNRVG